MIGEIDSLHPAFRIAVNRILNGMRGKGWDPVIGSGMRTNQQQDALFAQGRKSLNQVNTLRVNAGLSKISAAANAAKVTDARGGQSNHNRVQSMIPHGRDGIDVTTGYAVDIVDRRHGWEIPDRQFWKDLGYFAKKYGCEWGGDWKKPDPAHVQMKLVEGAPLTSVVV